MFCKGCGEPFAKFQGGSEQMGHQEMQQCPQFAHVVLQWRACEQEAAVAGILHERLPPRTLVVLDVVRFI